MKLMRKKAIVVVDNDESFVELINTIFKEYGFFVFGAKSSECLFKLLHSITPEVIFMDYWLDGEKGSDICAALQSERELKKIPVIFMTTSEFKNEIKDLKVNKLYKPFELGALVDMVNKVTG